MSIVGRRLQFAGQSALTQPTSNGWTWHGSSLDNMGGCMVAHYDGANWFTASDIGGVHKLRGSIGGAGTVPQFDAGRSNVAAGNGFNVDFHKVSAVHSNGVMAYTVGGDGSAGAIHSRNLQTDNKWTLRSTNYYGNVKGSIGAGRPVGNRRIYIDDATNCVYIACQSLSDGNCGGIAISKNGGNFTNFHNASTFNVGRMFRALQGSANWSDIVYASADNQTGVGASNGNAPGIFVYTGASTSSPAVTRIDNIGGGPANKDWKDMCVVNEGGIDALYIACGYIDGSSGGIWRCRINSNPNNWGTPNITWTQLLSAEGAGTSANPSIDYRGVYAYRSGSATYVVATTNPAQNGTGAKTPDSLSGSIPISGASYCQEIVRTLNGHTNTPTWDAVTNAANVSPGGNFLSVYNTGGASAETWLQEAGSMNSSLNGNQFLRAVLGGPAHEVFDVDVDPASQRIVVAGKQGGWIGFNIWNSDPTAVKWQPFSAESGNCTNHGIEVHPTNALAFAHSDTDRLFYFNLEGGDGQDRGCAANYSGGPPIGQSTFVRQGSAQQGRLLVGDTNGKINVSDDWFSVADRDTAPTISVDSVGSATGTIVAVGEWSYSGNTYRLALDDSGSWNLKKNSGSWAGIGSSIGGLTDSTHGEYRVIANDGYADCWVMVSSNGLYYCPNIAAASPNFSKIWNQTAQDQEVEGRVTQDATTRTTLYVTWGQAFNGVWKLTRCDATTFASSGSGSNASVTASGNGTATPLTGGSLQLSGYYGSLDVDPTNGSIVVCEPGYAGVGDVHYAADGQTFVSIADDLYPDVAQMPNAVRKRGNRIYVGCWTAGVAYAVLS
jgi:hypothetical protein